MSFLRGRLRQGALGLAGLAAVAAPVLAPALPRPEVFSKLERGRWEVRDSGRLRSICLGDPSAMIQLEHRAIACEQELIADDKDGATVQYSCPGHGYGHTSIRIETPRLARVETQGLVDGRPFSYRAEARKVGGC